MRNKTIMFSIIALFMFLCGCTNNNTEQFEFYSGITELYTWVGDDFYWSFCYPEPQPGESCGVLEEKVDPVGGTSPYTFSLSTSSLLAPGLTLASNGILSGSPTLKGDYDIEVCAIDNAGNEMCKPVTITVDDFTSEDNSTDLGTDSGTIGAPLEFTVIDTLDANVGTYFEHSFCEPQPEEGHSCGVFNTVTNPTGGSQPYTFSVGFDGGLMAPGLTLSLNGILSGTPTLEGIYNVQICIRDNAMNDECDFTTITVNPEIPVAEETPLTLTFDSINCSLIRREDIACGYNQRCITDYYEVTASGTISGPVSSGIFIMPVQADPYDGQYYSSFGGDDKTLMTASWDNDNRYDTAHTIRRAEGNPESTTWTYMSGEVPGYAVEIASAFHDVTPEMTANERKIKFTARASYEIYSGNWDMIDIAKEVVCE